MLDDIAPQSQTPRMIGPYQIHQELGRNREGGRITYLGSNSETDQQVVLKQFRFIQTESSWSGFKSHEREIQILQAIQHPQVPRYLDSFETADGFCMVQEYKNAPALSERYHLTPAQVYTVGIKLLQVLAELQQQVPPIIHRDIKPENILVDNHLEVFLIDFGLAKLNQETTALSSVAAGTPGFMPPEEIFNRPLGTSADLYSVGATIISLLTQQKSAQISELIDETYRFNFIPYLPEISPRMIRWLIKMVEPNPHDRYANAKDALVALEDIDILDLTDESVVDSNKPKTTSLIAKVGAGVIALSGLGIIALEDWSPNTIPLNQTQSDHSQALSTEEAWFENIKPRCNTLEVVTAIQNSPFPTTPSGAGYGASCYALAGKLIQAEEAILSLPENSQIYAASILFQIGHPVADSGDDESAGPIMDLVLKYWPENYMALYHAGMSAYVLEENKKAIQHLEAFLEIYQPDDGWTQKAKLALSNIQQGILADERFKVHH